MGARHAANVRRPLLIIASLAVVAGIGVSAAVVWTQRPPPADDADPVVVVSPSPSLSAAAPPPEPPEPAEADPGPWAHAEWEFVEEALRAEPDPLFRVSGMIDGGDQLVAWGMVPMPGRNQFNSMGAVFVSADGREWRVTPIEHGVNAASTSEIYGIARGPTGYLAIGTACCDPEARAFWHSADLERWTRQEIGGDLDATRFYVNEIAGGPAGWVAVGSDFDGTTGAVWASDDGATWDLVLEVQSGRPGLTLADVAMTPDGPIVVGTVDGPDGTYDGAVWASSDGRAWERVGADDPDLVGEGEVLLSSVVHHAGGLYVIGTRATTEEREFCESLGMAAPLEAGPPAPALSCAFGRELAWISVDAETWEQVDNEAAPGLRPTEFRLVKAGGPGLVLLGESSGPASPDTMLFTSPDGRAWTPVEPLDPIGNGVGTGLVVRDRQVIVVSDHSVGGPSQFQVWLATVR
jgi:hypothetical protein